MRRYTFYLSIALLAFGIGSFVVFKFYLKAESVSSKVQEMSETNIFVNKYGDVRSNLKKVSETPIENPLPVKKQNAFTCRDKILSVVLTDLRKDKVFNESAKYYLEDDNPSSCKDILLVEKSVDLNNDGIKEAVVRGKNSLLCGGTGNCPIWIYEKTGARYKKLLFTGGETLEVKSNSANGYRNIFVRVHDSCCSSYLYTYKFDGEKYKESMCLFENYWVNGKNFLMTCAEKTKQNQEQLRESELELKNKKSNSLE